MSALLRVVLLSILALVSVPALAGAQSQAPDAARGPLAEVIVTLDAPPLARGGHLRTLSAVQGNVEAGLAATVPDLTVQRRFSTVVDGLAVKLPQSEVDRLQSVDGVTKVYPNVSYHTMRVTTPSFIGAPALWGPRLANAGQSVKIGIIDDGVDRVHPYFSARGYKMPRGFPKGNKRFTDAKVIVARAFAPRSPKWKYARRPFDPLTSEHATHVAGIAAGNYRTNARGNRVSGVAPRAYIGNYKVLTIPDDGFGLNGNSAEIVAGIEAAVRDGMDVINLSLGEAEIDPSRDIVARALDGAAAAGVVPVVAAGNDYEDFGAGSVTSPGSSASAITAAAESQSGPFISSFSSGGPTPLSLRMKPDVTAPGEDVLSSVPRRDGTWARFSGTSMAAPHVAGAAALLRQRHRSWTVEQIKSALVLTGKPVLGPGGAEVDTTREGGGTIDLVRADRPLVFASPTSLAFGFVAPGGSTPRQVALSDAGGGAGEWTVSATLQQPAAGATVTVPPLVTIPGPLAITATAAPGAAEATHTGFVVLQRGTDRRRIPFWFRVASPKLGLEPTTPLTRTGTYHGDTRGRPALVSSYRYPEDARTIGVERTLLGPEQVFRVSITRPVANFGVVVVASAHSNVEPRVVRAGDENQLLGQIGLPFNANPYLPAYGTPMPVAGGVLPAPGDYDVVFDSGSGAGAGAFTFRFWINDTTPPRLKLISVHGRKLRVSAADNGAGIDPRFIRLSVDGYKYPVRYDASRGEITASLKKKLRRGRHRFTLRVSDYQEPKNMENVPKILPNTARLHAAFTIR
jgi:subtilisin family serine protease